MSKWKNEYAFIIVVTHRATYHESYVKVQETREESGKTAIHGYGFCKNRNKANLFTEKQAYDTIELLELRNGDKYSFSTERYIRDDA